MKRRDLIRQPRDGASAAGLTVRDVAQLLGVTPSRVSQIEKHDHLISSA